LRVQFYLRHERLLWLLATPAAVLAALLCWVGGVAWAAYFFAAVAVVEAATFPLRLKRARARSRWLAYASVQECTLTIDRCAGFAKVCSSARVLRNDTW